MGFSLSYDFPAPNGLMGGVHGWGGFFILNTTGDRMLDIEKVDGYLAEHITRLTVDDNGDVIFSGFTHSKDFFTTPHSLQYPAPSGILEQKFIAKYRPYSGFIFSSLWNTDKEVQIEQIETDQECNIIY